jgi:hypothetical protein
LTLSIDLTSSEYVVGGPADNIPVDAPQGERSYRVRPILEGKNRGRHFVRKTLSPRSNRILSQTSVQPSTLREPSPTRATQIQHRDRIHAVRVGAIAGASPVRLLPTG